jgi:hypothetical protein
MSEIYGSKVKAEITVICLRTKKVSTHVGRYGLFYEAYGLCVSQGYTLIAYRGIYS